MNAKSIMASSGGRWAAVAGLLLAGWIGGCQEYTGPVAGQPDVVADYPKVTITEPALGSQLGLNTAVVTRSANGLLQVSQPVRAQSTKPLYIEYRVVWFDEQGNVLQPEMTWRAKRLEPRQPDRIIVNALSEDAMDYNLQIRFSRP